MNILVINCGSSSLKYQLIDINSYRVLSCGLCERLNENGIFSYKNDGIESKKELLNKGHKAALESIFKMFIDSKILKSIKDIKAIGHRVVHGGEYFLDSVVIDDDVIEKIEACIPLAPMHNPIDLMGIKICKELLPNVPMVAVFDTSFHQSIESRAYLYALPYEWYEKYKIRKYGFHGTSHRYVSKRAIELLNLDENNSKLITCHLGNGSSICAIKNGKSIDTSMGLTPLEGLIMGTRSGDIDPSVIKYIMKKENLNIDEAIDILNTKSGVLGISKISSDFRDLIESKDNELAKLALDMFAYRIAKYIGSYMVALGGLDGLVFCAGIGEGSPYIRSLIIGYLDFLGINLDSTKNKNTNMGVISTLDSKAKICVIPTNEELVIALDTYNLIFSN